MADVWLITLFGCACYLGGLCHGWMEKSWSLKRRADKEPNGGR